MAAPPRLFRGLGAGKTSLDSWQLFTGSASARGILFLRVPALLAPALGSPEPPGGNDVCLLLLAGRWMGLCLTVLAVDCVIGTQFPLNPVCHLPR